jgi:Flp pilus assembly protein TadG
MDEMTERSKHRKRGRRDEGQALVEFALIMPVFLLLVMGVVEFGRAWNSYQVVTDAAREGARMAVMADTFTIANVYATMDSAMARAGLNPATATRTVSPTAGWPSPRGTPMEVNISYPYFFRFLKPFMSWTTGQASLTLKTSIVMRHE